MTVTAFSLPFDLYIGGTGADTARMGEITLTRQCPSPPTSGFISSVLRFTHYGSLPVTSGQEISISTGQGSYSRHFVTRIERRGNVVTVYAEDLCSRLDLPFDSSSYTTDRIHVPTLVSRIASDCGFSGTQNVPAMFIAREDLSNRTSREILTLISEYLCGVWCCTNDEKLRFTQLFDLTSTVSLTGEHTPLYLHTQNGPYDGMIAKNRETKEYHTAGNLTGDVLYLTAAMMTDTRAGELMTAFAGKSRRAFYLECLVCDDLTQGLTGIVQESTLISEKTVTRFAPLMTLSLRAKDITDPSAPPQEYREYLISQSLRRGEMYGATIMTEKGLCVLEKSTAQDVRDRGTYSFKEATGGVTDFEGAIMDSVMPESIERLSPTSRRITYNGVVYTLTYSDDGTRKTNITLTRAAT